MGWKKVENQDAEVRYEKEYTHTYKKKISIKELQEEISRIEKDIERLEEKKALLEADLAEINSIKGK